MENSIEFSKQQKEKKKDKNKHKVDGDSPSNISCAEAVDENGPDEVDGNFQKGDPYLKKNRKREHEECKDFTSKTFREEKGEMSLHRIDKVHSEKDIDISSEKSNKKKSKQKRDKDFVSWSMDMLDIGDAVKDPGEVHKSSANKSIIKEKSDEKCSVEMNKLKKRQQDNGSRGKSTSVNVEEKVKNLGSEAEKFIELGDKDMQKAESKKRKKEKLKKREDDAYSDGGDTDGSEVKNGKGREKESKKHKSEGDKDLQKVESKKSKKEKVQKKREDAYLDGGDTHDSGVKNGKEAMEKSKKHKSEGDNDLQKVESKKSKKGEKEKVKKTEEDSYLDGGDTHDSKVKNGNEGMEKKSKKHKSEGEKDLQKVGSKKRKKREKVKKREEDTYSNGGDTHDGEVKNDKERVKKKSKKHKSEGKLKKVTFSNRIEVFPCDDASHSKGDIEDAKLVQGRRFSLDEDEIIKESVFSYIESHALGEEGFYKVMHCKAHKEVRHCWQEIAAALPHRPVKAIYSRAHVIFGRSENRKWTEEDCKAIKNYQKEHGNDWIGLAKILGKHRIHVKDTWRRINVKNLQKGQWSQDEYQALFDSVNMDLRLKVFEEKTSKHGMLRDNICWSGVGDKVSTRSDPTCCEKWYRQLTSPMVVEGLWADSDDYRLLYALFNLDACCVEDVEWDNLIEHRTGDVCRKRWYQMASHIGYHGDKSFAGQVEVLAQRYCPNLLEAREAWDNKPRVP